MGSMTEAHDPSVREDADTSPCKQGEDSNYAAALPNSRSISP